MIHVSTYVFLILHMKNQTFYNKCEVDFNDIIERICLEYKEKG